MSATIEQVLAAITTVSRKLDVIMSQQSEIDADVQAIDQDETDLAAAVTAIEAEIAALKTANPAVNLTALDAAVGTLKTAVGTVAAIPPAPATPPTA